MAGLPCSKGPGGHTHSWVLALVGQTPASAKTGRDTHHPPPRLPLGTLGPRWELVFPGLSAWVSSELPAMPTFTVRHGTMAPVAWPRWPAFLMLSGATSCLSAWLLFSFVFSWLQNWVSLAAFCVLSSDLWASKGPSVAWLLNPVSYLATELVIFIFKEKKRILLWFLFSSCCFSFCYYKGVCQHHRKDPVTLPNT